MERSGIGIRGAGENPNGLRPFFRSMSIVATGLSAQRTRIETIADNIANAETTRTEDGTPYRRKIVHLKEIPFADLMNQRETRGPGPWVPGVEVGGEVGGVEVVGVGEDTSEGPIVYDPGHPDANEDGYVQMSNVRLTDELVDLMEARRLYEANASVFDAVKSMLHRATQL
jgi:flagellar basal-body rod protein FlgC